MTRQPKAPKAPPAFAAENPFSGLDRIVGFHLRLAQGAVYRHFTETFSDLDLTQKQVSILWLISQNAGVAQADLGRMLQIDRATMMAIVNRLQQRALVVRDRSAIDGRRQTLTLTAAGKTRLAEARRAIEAHEEWLKSRFSDGEVAILVELLRRIHGQNTAPPKA